MKYGRYEIIKELGRGSMGMVYLAHDPNINREVALKILRPDRVESADFVQRFLKEARAIGRLAHPNIVTVYDVGEDQKTVFIAMELLEGLPLNVHARDKALSIDEITELGIEIASSLDYAHGKGIVHRDIKPPNIMITENGRVKITDFGIAHIDDAEATQQTQAGEILGTPNYMSPEQVLGKKVDGRSDLFSLGVILYELISGIKPFKGENLGSIFNAITMTDPVKLADVKPDTPQALSDIIMKTLSKDPALRYQTGKEMADALAATRKKQQVEAGILPRKVKPGKRIATAAIIAVAVLLIAAAIFIMTGKKDKPAIVPAPQSPAVEAALSVESEPSGAQVFIDGKSKGTSPVKIPLNLGEHEVRISMPGYLEWEAQVNLDKKGEQPLKITLEPQETKPN
jgi:eukaryotic-like serine/threonine-protein kinase